MLVDLDMERKQLLLELFDDHDHNRILWCKRMNKANTVGIWLQVSVYSVHLCTWVLSLLIHNFLSSCCLHLHLTQDAQTSSSHEVLYYILWFNLIRYNRAIAMSGPVAEAVEDVWNRGSCCQGSGIEVNSAELSGKFFAFIFQLSGWVLCTDVQTICSHRSLALSTVAMWLPISVPGAPPNSWILAEM